MKRTLAVMLSLVLFAGLLTACKNNQTAATQATTQPPAESTGGLEDSIFPENNVNDQQTQASTAPTTTTTPTTATTPTTSTTPTTPVTPTTPSGAVSIDYETFKAMTGAEKKAYQESFETIDAFFEWYNAALDAYKKANPPTEIDGSGNITLP